MTLVEKMIVKPNHKYYKEIDHICFLSKNLYNSTLYAIRQHYFETKEYLNYYAVNSIFTQTSQKDYCALPRKVSKYVQMGVQASYKSYFALLKKKSKGLYDKPVRLPKYLDKVSGRYIATYGSQSLSTKINGYVKLSGTNILIKTDKKAKFVRLVPKNGYYVIEIGYQTECAEPKSDNGRYASIDLGVNNLATVTSNVTNPIIVNGKPLKAINHYANAQLAKYRSLAEKVNGQYTSKRLKAIYRIRENKISDYLHRASRFIVNHLVSNNINTLIIGYNEGWKQDTRMRKDDKQNFLYSPFASFVHKLQYKCQLVGITVIVTEESYTSKSSFMNLDNIPTYGKDNDSFIPTGKRIHRGLYRNVDGTVLNADVNGAYNIMRKALTKNAAWNENIFSDCVQVCSTPLVISL